MADIEMVDARKPGEPDPDDVDQLSDDDAAGNVEADGDSGALHEGNGSSQSNADAMMAVLMEAATAGLTKLRRDPEDFSAAFLTTAGDQQYVEVSKLVDDMLQQWKGDPTFKSNAFLEEDKPVQDFSWVAVGKLVWAKHQTHPLWPCVISKLIDKKTKADSRVGIIFIEPDYANFLQYKKRPLPKVVRNLYPFTPMLGGRSAEEKRRSNDSWGFTCSGYSYHTMFELSERMAIVYSRNLERIFASGQFNMDLLGALFWLADIEWRKLTGRPVQIPDPEPEIDQFKDDMVLLQDISHWREPAHERQNTARTRDADFREEEESKEGHYGFDYIPTSGSVRRDSTAMVYSDESKDMVQARTAYAEKVLAKVKSPECRDYLRMLRDAPPDSGVHTGRTGALASGQMWMLMHQNIRSPSGPIVEDIQVFDLYRAMRVVRRKKDRDNVKFLRECYDVWLPEALIYALQEIDGLTYEEAEKVYQEGPKFAPEEYAANWDTMPIVSMAEAVTQ